MGLWNSLVGGNKESDWSELASLYLDNRKKYFSVSEIDKEEVPIVFSESHKISFNKTGLGLDYTPNTSITIYHIDTRKGVYELTNRSLN